MVKIVNVRDNGMVHKPIERQELASAALHRMVKGEFADGGKITAVSETSITVETNFLGCVDTTTFSGSEEEMIPFLDIAYYVAQFTNPDRCVYQVLEKLGSNVTSRQAHVRDAGSLLLGSRRLFVACMLAMGVTKREDIAFGLGLDFDDLFALLQLVSNKPGYSLQELAVQFDLADALQD